MSTTTEEKPQAPVQWKPEETQALVNAVHDQVCKVLDQAPILARVMLGGRLLEDVAFYLANIGQVKDAVDFCHDMARRAEALGKSIEEAVSKNGKAA